MSDFSLEVIQSWRATAMIEYIKNHLDCPKEQLEEICNNYLKFIKEITFRAYE